MPPEPPVLQTSKPLLPTLILPFCDIQQRTVPISYRHFYSVFVEGPGGRCEWHLIKPHGALQTFQALALRHFRRTGDSLCQGGHILIHEMERRQSRHICGGNEIQVCQVSLHLCLPGRGRGERRDRVQDNAPSK